MVHAHGKPTVITDAERSPEEQLHSRQVRYGVMMGIRALLLIVASILVMAEAPLLWLWVPLCVVGMVILPWTAVLVANDRLPKEEHRIRRRRFRRQPSTAPQLAHKPSQVIDDES